MSLIKGNFGHSWQNHGQDVGQHIPTKHGWNGLKWLREIIIIIIIIHIHNQSSIIAIIIVFTAPSIINRHPCFGAGLYQPPVALLPFPRFAAMLPISGWPLHAMHRSLSSLRKMQPKWISLENMLVEESLGDLLSYESHLPWVTPLKFNSSPLIK